MLAKELRNAIEQALPSGNTITFQFGVLEVRIRQRKRLFDGAVAYGVSTSLPFIRAPLGSLESSAIGGCFRSLLTFIDALSISRPGTTVIFSSITRLEISELCQYLGMRPDSHGAYWSHTPEYPTSVFIADDIKELSSSERWKSTMTGIKFPSGRLEVVSVK